LKRAELPADTVELARFLLGKWIVRDLRGERLSGRIVETEAYVVGDAACHAFRGETRRNRSLFLERGHAYVYLAYGTSYMLNVSSERAGVGSGVLVRALEPREGIERMRALRGDVRPLDLTRGPGRLAQALDIDLRLDGVDLCAPGELWLAATSEPARPSGESTRIGLTKDTERVLRFYERGSPWVSGPRRLRS
jgi:DNA-3-methyladenine glycosylase